MTGTRYERAGDDFRGIYTTVSWVSVVGGEIARTGGESRQGAVHDSGDGEARIDKATRRSGAGGRGSGEPPAGARAARAGPGGRAE